MSFFERQYEVFAVLGDPKAEPAWIEPRWERIAHIFDPLIQKARDRAAVRSTQLNFGPGSPDQRAISFGRIGWNDKGHKKWVHALITDDRTEFISTEGGHHHGPPVSGKAVPQMFTLRSVMSSPLAEAK
jgi:hypothetical protein